MQIHFNLKKMKHVLALIQLFLIPVAVKAYTGSDSIRDINLLFNRPNDLTLFLKRVAYWTLCTGLSWYVLNVHLCLHACASLPGYAWHFIAWHFSLWEHTHVLNLQQSAVLIPNCRENKQISTYVKNNFLAQYFIYINCGRTYELPFRWSGNVWRRVGKDKFRVKFICSKP